jgi:hypothetical protein
MVKYDPDYVYRYRTTLLDLKASRPNEYDDLLKRNIENFIKAHPDSTYDTVKESIETQVEGIYWGSTDISDNLQTEIKRRLNPFHRSLFLHDAQAGIKPAYPLTYLPTAIKGTGGFRTIFAPRIESTTEFQLLAYSLTGKVNSMLIEDAMEVGSEVTQEGFRISFQEWSGKNLSTLLTNAWKENIEFSEFPYPTTMIGLSYYFKHSERFEWSEKPVVILGDTLKDYCLYYNLSRMRWQAFWLPMKLLGNFVEAESASEKSGRWVEGEASYLAWLWDEIENLLRAKEEKKIYLYSTSITKEDFQKVITAFENAQIFIPKEPVNDWFEIQPAIDQLLPYIRRVYEKDGIGRSYVEQFYQGESINFLNTPIPKQFPKIPPHGHSWITEVRIDGNLPPPIANLGPKTIVYKNYGTNETRISREGPVYFCPHIAYFYDWGRIENYVVRPKLRVLDDFSIVEELFMQAGYHVKYSDKGNYHRESSLRFGSFDDMADFFMANINRNLLMKYLSKDPSGQGEGIWLQNEGRRYLCLNDIKQIAPADTSELLDTLFEKGILHRGFIFQCKKCSNSAWYPIEEVTNTFKCSRCRTEQIYKHEHWKHPEEPAWYYQLDEVIYQGLTHNMHIPVLALRNLKKRAKEGFHYSPEIEIREDKTSKKPDLELDFVAVIDGEIFLGEAKKDNEISRTNADERTKLDQLKKIVLILPYVTLVLATLSENWAERTVNNAKEIFGMTSCATLFLTRKDLLSS